MKPARASAYVFGFFTIIAATAILVASARLKLPLPDEVSRLDALKRTLSDDPENEEVKNRLRELDAQHRLQDWEMWNFINFGSWILAASAAGLVISVQIQHLRCPRRPVPPGAPAPRGESVRRARSATRAVASMLVLSLGLSAGTAAIVWWANRPVEMAPEPVIDVKWTQFRGPGGQGHTDMAVTLEGMQIDFDSQDPALGWRSRVALPGKSSPVLWGNHLFLTGANERSRKVFAYSAATGRLLWDADIPPLPEKEGEHFEVEGETGYAAPTGCTDGKRFYAIYTDVTVAAVDFDGNVLWHRFLGPPHSTYGFSASMIMADGKLIVQYDQAFDEDDDGNEIPRSRLLALDPETGKSVWETKRNVRDSWSSPILIDTSGGKRIITATDPWVIAYEPVAGKEIWRVKALGGDMAPSPVFDGKKVYVAMDGNGTTAIRVGGKGDVTRTHIAWRNEKTAEPDTVSPLLVENGLLTVTGGMLNCLDLETGKRLWKHSFDGRGFNSSPSRVGGGKILLLDQKGRFYLAEAGKKEFRILQQFDLGQACDSTPAFGAGRIFIRGKRHVFGLKVPGDGFGS